MTVLEEVTYTRALVIALGHRVDENEEAWSSITRWAALVLIATGLVAASLGYDAVVDLNKRIGWEERV